MMTGKIKKAGLIIVMLAAVGAAVGYFFWNKPHTNVSAAESIKVNAAELYQLFIKDTAQANKKYIDQVLEVSGTVKIISANQQRQKIVALHADAGDAAINCTLEQQYAGEIKEGAAIKVKGICSGFGEGDADLGITGDVYLIRCYIVE